MKRTYVIKSSSGDYWNGATSWVDSFAEAARWSTLYGASSALDLLSSHLTEKGTANPNMWIVVLRTSHQVSKGQQG
jgi:hypothetical protein